MNKLRNCAEIYIQNKLSVKSYLIYLDDMVNRKGQPQKAAFARFQRLALIDLDADSALDSHSELSKG
jgi:hypothetical protein